ncbi:MULTISPECIES: chlorite dismutase family protein [Ferrimicrobium]|uniref:Coproheme decarboxylase n=2 Tax=Ferrimicrobium TaxID=121038 RepID=A0ABV3Y203_9ACTN|nr:chlorite dismutase family protein [Ferrimicrobium sp.]MCL5972988.1 chlorite dismutase family protein [Actinomycetota bacterium]
MNTEHGNPVDDLQGVAGDDVGSQVTEGLGVLHLFGQTAGDFDPELATARVKQAADRGTEVLTVATLGHRCEVAIMALDRDLLGLRRLQLELRRAGLSFSDSFFSITEVSEYARNITEERKRPRLYPKLPPKGKDAWCFYPMSKRRNVAQNWYSLDFEERERLMGEHGASGRKFAGRVVQLVTGATGVSDWEWGVTLFARHPDDLKDVVYTMRYDEASATYAEFGPFYVGIVQEPEVVFASLVTGL